MTATLIRPAAAAGKEAARGGRRTVERRYQVGALLGRGAEADVYHATDLLSGGSAALKIFRAGTANPDSPFNREIELLARLHHNNIVRIKTYGRLPADGGTGSGRNYIAADLAAGTDLRRAIHDQPVDAADVTAWMGGIASALAHIHRKGIVHNDVKPANIMVTRAADTSSKTEAKLIDFGIATSSWHRPNTDVSGTPHYLSPEAVHGQCTTSASDIYALGLVIFESLTGIKAFPGPALESMVARTLRSPRLPATVQRRWSRLLLAMTDTDPARRPNATEVHRTLQKISR